MSFDIEARIENGQPSLRILDADSQAVRLAWSCPHCEEPCTGPEGLALQRLFRELFLLSLLEKLDVPHRNPPVGCASRTRDGAQCAPYKKPNVPYDCR